MKRSIIFSNYDAPQNPYYGGGGARAIHEIARRLAGRHEVSVITGNYPAARHETVDGVQYLRLGSPRAGPRAGQLHFQFLLPREVRRCAFDLWAESLTPPFSTACLQVFTRRPVVALTQVLAGKAMSRKYHLPFGVIERLGLRTYRYAIALSPHLKRELLRANPRLRVEVIPNGVDGSLIARPLEREPAHILFLGRLDIQQKGLDLLLEAFHSVSRGIRAPLVIAGSGSDHDTRLLERRIAELGLRDQVRLAGRVAGAVKDDLLRRAFFLVLPSRFEASPLVVAEAFCYGLPVLLFGIPELADLPDDCCVKVRPFDVPAMGAALCDLAQDQSRLRTMSRAAKAAAAAYDWDDLARRYEEWFENILRTP